MKALSFGTDVSTSMSEFSERAHEAMDNEEANQDEIIHNQKQIIQRLDDIDKALNDIKKMLAAMK